MEQNKAISLAYRIMNYVDTVDYYDALDSTLDSDFETLEYNLETGNTEDYEQFLKEYIENGDDSAEVLSLLRAIKEAE